MSGFGGKKFLLSMAPVYLFVFILIANQFVLVHPLVFAENDQDQNPLANLRQDAFRRLSTKSAFNSEEDASLDDDDFQSFSKRTAQRRFCCMNPLSGRKRFARDLARKQQLTNVPN